MFRNENKLLNNISKCILTLRDMMEWTVARPSRTMNMYLALGNNTFR